MTERVINSLGSMFPRKQKDVPMAKLQDAHELLGIEILGQGSDSLELHVRYSGSVKNFPLINPVTALQIADILLSLD